MAGTRPIAPIGRIGVAAFTVPTEAPESDGTLEWSETTIVVVEAEAGGQTGLGYTYAAPAAAQAVLDLLEPAVLGLDAFDVPRAWERMVARVRNAGRGGLAAMAVSAVDAALWDLKATILGLPLARLLGQARDAVPIYGSGGFTSYTESELREHLGRWADAGIRKVKMKVGREPDRDAERVHAAREAIGADSALFVDANGAYSRKQALEMAEIFAGDDVTWFEEPVSSDDLEGLRLLRDRAPCGMDIAAGEYGYDPVYFRRMLDAGAVDVLQVDATRCAGITGFMQAAALCDAYMVPLSAHTAPALHLHAACALPAVRHIEYFHDHARIEGMLFDGAVRPEGGMLRPDLARPGMGLNLKRADARKLER